MSLPPPLPRIRAADDDGIALAAALIAAGKPVGLPTETVYGLAGDATSGAAVAAIYAAKGRPSFNPLIVHVASLRDAEMVARLSPTAHRLAARFWPGPLTMVLPIAAASPVAALATAGLATVAVRMPAHAVMRAVIVAAGVPLVAPSANASGSISPTRADHVARSLAGRIELVLDGGATEVGLESTIVAVEADHLRLLRPGPILIRDLEAAGGVPVLATGGEGIEAPGQMASHYAPSKPVRLDAREAEADEYHVGFGNVAGQRNLSPGGDVIEAAAALFEALHQADAAPEPRIAIAPIPETGMGMAINDRLGRAAAPR